MRRFVSLSVMVACCLCAAAPTLHVPQGRPVMIDGNIEAGEWSDAATAELDGLARLYIKTLDTYVWLTVQFGK